MVSRSRLSRLHLAYTGVTKHIENKCLNMGVSIWVMINLLPA